MNSYNDIEKGGLTPGRFYNAARPIFLFARFFGVMPVQGLLSSDPKDLEFSWYSVRVLHTMLVTTGLALFLFMAIYRIFSENLSFSRASPVVFYASNLYAMVCFLFLARKFPQLMIKWTEVESELPQVKTKNHQFIMTRKIRLTGFLFLVTSVVEHLLRVAKRIYFANNCQSLPNKVESYYRKAAPHIFHIFDYSPIRGIITTFFLITSTFLWNYMDVFIIILSFGLSKTFKQINWILMDVKRKNMPLEFWLKFRVYYRHIIILCELVDDTICTITLVSFSNNFFFICIIFLEIADPAPTMLDSVSYWFGFLYLITKSYFVSVNCSKVHEESRYPLEVLRCVPRKSWHPELKKFMDEIKHCEVGLSGMKFFYITKGLILTVAGSIFTYDLMLIHFHNFDQNETNPCF